MAIKQIRGENYFDEERTHGILLSELVDGFMSLDNLNFLVTFKYKETDHQNIILAPEGTLHINPITIRYPDLINFKRSISEAYNKKIKAQQDEVDKNYKKFKELLSDLVKTNLNEYALLSDGKFVTCLETNEDAKRIGRILFTDNNKLYSIQQVEEPIERNV